MLKYITSFALLLSCIHLSAQEWEPMATMPDGFHTDHAFGFAIDGTGYVVAGNVGGSGYSKSFYSYDPIADQWSRKADFPGVARGFAIGEVWDGKAYFGFGASTSGSLDDFWSYDPVTDAWTQLSSCACNARTHPAMVALNGQIFLGLGGGTPTGNANDWWAYDIATDTWSERARFPAAERHHPFQFTDGTSIFVGFGHGNGFISDQWYKYDPITDVWEEVQRLPAEGRVAGTQMSHRGLGFVLSGDGDDHGVMPTGEFWMYDSEADQWSSLPPHPGVSRWAPTSFIIGDVVYFINGERNGQYFENNFKFDLSGIFTPKLFASATDVDEEYMISEAYCDRARIQPIKVRTRLAFDVDANIALSVSDLSTAVEGEDFILIDTEAILPAGENEVELMMVILDDAVVSVDKTIVLDFTADVDAGNDQVIVVIGDNDDTFDGDIATVSYQAGTGTSSSNAVFAAFYSNARTQMIYRAELLQEARLAAGPISNLSFEVTGPDPSLYTDYTVSIAHTNIDNFSGNLIESFEFQEVYRGNFRPTTGTTELILDTPFEYDGVSNLAIQICFDNPNYTVDDPVMATDVGYNASVTLLADFVNGCPSTGIIVSNNLLPNLTIKRQQYRSVFDAVGDPFQSSIMDGEEAYFSRNDSILAIVKHLGGEEPACVSSELLSADTEAVQDGDLAWIDRVYKVDVVEGGSEDLELTIVMPDVESFDWDNGGVKILYSAEEVDGSSGAEWTLIDPLEIVINPEYALLRAPFQGTGYYTAGGKGLILSSEDVIASEEYDLVTVYDLMGRIVYTDSQLLPTVGQLPLGIYIATYSLEGKMLRSEKIFR